MWLKTFAISSLALVASCYAESCVPRDYGQGSTVCVCNSTYCDTVEAPTEDQITGGSVRHYVTSKAGPRLMPMTMKFSSTSGEHAKSVTFKVNRNTKYQKMNGFGGAATDATGINTYSLSTKAAENLIRSYFSKDGIGYSFIRVPVAGSDFSAHYYEYTDDHPNDTTLKYFNLTMEDYTYKIPFIKKAQELSPREVKLFSAPWSAPDWMKNINTTTKASSLKKEYYQVFADYYIKFLDGYKAEGLEFWGITPQNEPSHGLTYGMFNSMGWMPSQMLEYLVGNLCPTLKSNGYKDIKLMINDNQRSDVNDWLELYKNETLRECASGMAVHWYTDRMSPADILAKAHEEFPDKFLLYTEACVTNVHAASIVALGDWSRGVQYMSDIIQVTNNWVSGWVDWNMALDLEGGPNWVSNFVDSPVIVNATADEFYKQPMFYALAHFAKFVPPGSVRIGLETEKDGGLENVAFMTPDNVTVIILHNINDSEADAVISDSDKGSLSLKLSPNSMNTILYK